MDCFLVISFNLHLKLYWISFVKYYHDSRQISIFDYITFLLDLYSNGLNLDSLFYLLYSDSFSFWFPIFIFSLFIIAPYPLCFLKLFEAQCFVFQDLISSFLVLWSQFLNSSFAMSNLILFLILTIIFYLFFKVI